VKGGKWNRLDAYDLEFHRRARAGYQRLASAEPQRWVVIDASQPPEQVQANIRQAVLTRLALAHQRG
jgi:dTMP kinase